MIWPGPSIDSTAVALIVERIIGYPSDLQRIAGHPVEWIGRLIAWLETQLNDPEADKIQARLRGAAALVILLAAASLISIVARSAVHALPFGWVWEALLAVPFIAQCSLRAHVRAVLVALESSLVQGRAAVKHIVGRDPQMLDESGVAKAALESLAENTSDGVVGPIFWFALLGLPGIVVYKAINTADSMIGHKSPRYIHFGWAAARLDDLVNFPCSRLSGLLFAAAATIFNTDRGRAALAAMSRDASKHVSPNAGWPEAALAGALGIRLGGPRIYEGHTVDLPTLADGRAQLEANDIRRGLNLFDRAMTLLAAFFVAVALLS